MTDRDLTAVGARLEAAVLAASPQPVPAADLYELYECLAIQILDSEHSNFPPQVLESFLLGYLAGLPLPH